MKLLKCILIFLCLINITAFILLITKKSRSNFCNTDNCCIQLKNLINSGSNDLKTIYNEKCNNKCPIASKGPWDYTYFYSGGVSAKDTDKLSQYTPGDINETTNDPKVTKNIKANGADPSCGGSDPFIFEDDNYKNIQYYATNDSGSNL